MVFARIERSLRSFLGLLGILLGSGLLLGGSGLLLGGSGLLLGGSGFLLGGGLLLGGGSLDLGTGSLVGSLGSELSGSLLGVLLSSGGSLILKGFLSDLLSLHLVDGLDEDGFVLVHVTLGVDVEVMVAKS